MTTGATGQLGLALPVQGELSGTWGDTVNNGITQYTNIAIAATLTLTNDGAVTLANTTGDASASNITSSLTGAGTVTAQFAIVRVTGTLTTTKVVTAPSYSKTYVVVNAATGGIVTFKASGQTGVSIAVGESAWVYYNGTDYVKIAGTAAGAAGGSNTQVQYNSSGALAGSSNLTFDGTSLTLGGNPTLSAGTANGVTYLNGSKVLTSGSALTFDGTNMAVGTTPTSFGAGYSVLTVQGSTTGFVQASNGTIVTEVGTYSGIGYTGTRSNHSYGFVVNGSEQMRLTSTGLGIGTSSPATKLDVNGSISIASSGNLTWGGAYGAGIPTIAIPSAGSIGFYPNGSTSGLSMVLNSSGNLGLGVTPSAWSVLGSGIQLKGGGSVVGRTDTVTQTNYTLNGYFNGTDWKYLESTTATRYMQYVGAHSWHIAPAGTSGNNITWTQAMTLDASGNLGVGTSSPSQKLEVAGNIYINTSGNPSMTVKTTGAGNNPIYRLQADTNYWDLQGTFSNAGDELYFMYNGSTKMVLSAAGGFSVGTTSDPGAGAIYATGNITAYYSDDRLKTRLGNIENALDKVDSLSGFYYEANETAQALGYKVKREVGVSAQSVQAVLPEIVSPAPIDQQYLTVDYERLVPLLIEAVKELRAEVKALKGV